MNKNISVEEANKLLPEIYNKPCLFRLFYAGVLNIEIGDIKNTHYKIKEGKIFDFLEGDYSIMIEGSWLLSKEGKTIAKQNYETGREAIEIENTLKELTDLSLQAINFTLKSTNFNFNNNYLIEIFKTEDINFSDWYINFSSKHTFLIYTKGKFILENKTPA